MSGISIIIVCFKSEFHLASLVDSIFQHLDIPAGLIQIIIVDNWGSGLERKITDDLSSKYEADFVYESPESNGGYGAGNNVGFRLAKYEIVAVINPDVRLVMPIFKKVQSEFEKNPSLLGLSGEQISRTRNSFFIRPEFQYPVLKELSGRLLKHLGIFHHQFMALSGAMTFYRKSLFLNIGLFDEKIFLYGEESDVSIRALRSDFILAYVPEIKYLHLDWDISKSSVNNIGHLVSSVSYYASKHGVPCGGYFLAGKLHYYIKYILFLFRRRLAESAEAKSLISMYDSKRKEL